MEPPLLEAPQLPEMAPAPRYTSPPTDGLRKAAVLLITIGDQASGEIIKHLTEAEIQDISKAISTATPVSSEEALSVLREFYQLSVARNYVVAGGMEYASKMLKNAFGVEYARRLLDRVALSIGNEMASFDSLQKAEPQQLANFVHSEHPQTVALILSHLNPSQAAALLTALPPHLRADLSRRMACLEQISPEIIAKIANVIGEKLKSLGDLSRESYGGVRAVAEMLNRMDARLRKDILNDLSRNDQELVDTIRHLMFVFEDLLTVDAAGVKELLAAVDRKTLIMALKGTSERLQEHIMKNMSQAGGEMLREDMEALGPVRIKDVETAQQQIISTARTLEAKGVLSLAGSAGEQYVV